MKRWSGINAVLLLLPVAAFAQEPAHPGQLFSSDLVSWSYMQQPEPQGARERPEPIPETQPSPSSAGPGPGQMGVSSQAPTSDTFIGTVNKESDGYVLAVSGATSYRLDDEQELQQYEGRRVRVTGALEPAVNLIHVEKIELLSMEPHRPPSAAN